MRNVKMMIIATLIVLIPGLSWAGPYLVCNPYSASVVQPTEFSVSIDGGVAVSSPAVAVTGGVALKYDL